MSFSISNIKDNHHPGFLENLSIWIGVIVCLSSIDPWFTWPTHFIKLGLSLLFVVSRFPFLKKEINYIQLVSFCGFIIFGFINVQFFQIPLSKTIYQIALNYLIIVTFIFFSKNEFQSFLYRLITLTSIILLFSLLAFLAHFFVDLPHISSSSRNDFYPPFDNYLFFVLPSGPDLGWLTRFCSIFTEPGHLAMVCSILLYLNGYTLKDWRNIVMTIALIWSFSLAGFVLYAVGLIIYIVAISRNIPLTLFKIVSTFAVLIGVGIAFYSPTNQDIVSVRILSRLQFDESKGLSGNNRNSATFDNYYDHFKDTDDYFLGIGRYQSDEMYGGTGNSSYKNYFVSNGLIGILSTLFIMGVFLFCTPSRRGLGFMLFLCISFIQRPYFIYGIQIMSYIAALYYWYDVKVSLEKTSCRCIR